MAIIDRTILLRSLSLAIPGLDTMGQIAQSECFVFSPGEVRTNNDEVSCCVPIDLDIDGSVVAKPLLKTLQKMKAEQLKVEVKNNRLVISAKGQRLTMAIESKSGPTSRLETPDQWEELPPDFSEAILLVKDCSATCVHFTPDWIEATDNFQMARYNIRLPLRKATLIRKESLKHLGSMGVTHVSETDHWLHFYAPSGLVYSCRHYAGQFPLLDPILEGTGQPVEFPRGLTEAVDRANIFSSQVTQNNYLLVQIYPDRVHLTGNGVNGTYEELRQLTYQGEPIGFFISPKILKNLIDKAGTCQIGEGKILVDIGSNYRYVSSVGTVEKTA